MSREDEAEHPPERKRDEPCDACSFRTDLKRFGGNGGEQRIAYLCRLCAVTYTGNAVVFYPENYDHQHRALLGAICRVGNEIIAAIRERKSE